MTAEFLYSIPGAILIVGGYALIFDTWRLATKWIEFTKRNMVGSIDPRPGGPRTRGSAALLGVIAVFMGVGYIVMAIYDG